MKCTMSIVSNIWIRQIELTYVGEEYGGHSHTFDHQHMLAIGEIDVTIDGKTTRFKAPQMVLIAKDKIHSIKAVSDKTLGFCIHPIRDGGRVEDIVDPESLPSNFDNREFHDNPKYTSLLIKPKD